MNLLNVELIFLSIGPALCQQFLYSIEGAAKESWGGEVNF
jgi:hypothetical protein